MNVITKEEFVRDKVKYARLIGQGAVFVYPTDTIYGIGCDATNHSSVLRVRGIKQRPSMPFSVIAPSKRWAYENCEITVEGERWLDRLPGPYTLVFRLKNDAPVARAVNTGTDTLGVRLPKHWIAGIVSELGFPLVSTSANVSGQSYMTSLDDLEPSVKAAVDFVVFDGEKAGRPSTIVRLYEEEVKVVER